MVAMAKGHLKSSKGAQRERVEIEKVAHTLRERLAFATIKANGNASITVQSLQEVGRSASPSPLSSAFTSPSTTRTSPMDEIEYNVGLGLGLESSADERETPPMDRRMECYSVDNKDNVASPLREPSLYDAIFGPAYTRMVRLNAKTNPTTPTKLTSKIINRSPPMARSPHVRQGSSAHLEKLASSPSQSSTSPKWHQQRQQVQSGSGGHFTERPSSSFAYPLDSPSQLRRKSACSGAGGGSNSHQRSLFGTPSRQRVRSAGGSLLPNGHPASSLAQDLGIASGSTPRSRNASNNVHFLNDRFDDHDQAETDRIAGLLSSMTSPRKTATPPPSRRFSSSSSSFADPNMVVTPRRKRRREDGELVDGNEAAAHSLLDLAASPSPNRNLHQERFPGATPSLDRLYPSRAHHATLSRRLVDELELKGETESLTEPSSSLSLEPAVSLRSIQKTPPKAIKQMNTPPMTPPRSDRRLQNKLFSVMKDGSENDDEDDDDNTSNNISPCPSTPSRRGQMVLMMPNETKEDGIAGQDSIVAPLRSIKTEDCSSNETPRTPPPLHTPTTPKVPGSNFSYGEFLHVSPSPQPRMRMYSSTGEGHTPRLGTLQGTPTKGTRSQARFINYGGLDMGSADPATPLTDLEMSDVLTPGRHPPPPPPPPHHHHHLLQSSPRIGTKKAKVVAD